MGKKRVLIVTQEMSPYTLESDIAEIANKLPQYLHDQGMELRILMPRYGLINKRRHRLHEVVRLSGMNIIVNDDDFPLIIKVASLPSSRMQVYFLENDDFFKRKALFREEDGSAFEDNPDRMAFFCKGVLETVKKFGWSPDIIHCHGWLTALVPFYIRTAYKTEPIFQNSKIIYSAYESEERFPNEAFEEKALSVHAKLEDLAPYLSENTVTPHNGAIAYADGLIKGSENVAEDVEKALIASGKPYVEFYDSSNYLPAYLNLYKQLLEQ
jgi:starch synthase